MAKPQEKDSSESRLLTTLGQSVLSTVLAAVILGVGAWFFGIGSQLARLETNLSNLADSTKIDQRDLKVEIEKTERRLSESIKESESRLIKQLDEMKGLYRDLERKTDELKTGLTAVRTDLESLKKLAAPREINIKAWLIAVAPTDAIKGVIAHLIDAQTGQIKSWPPIPVNAQDSEAASAVMGRFWAVAKGADASAETLELLLDAAGQGTEKPNLDKKFWIGCSFAMTIEPDAVPARLTSSFFVGNPRFSDGTGEKPNTVANLIKFLKENEAVLEK